jgi:galacturan 1,4-alpha-galacturonidase
MLNLLLLALCASTSARSLGGVANVPEVLVRRAAQPPFQVTIGPKPAFKPMPASSARDRECVVKGGSPDDSAAILAAITSCNGGGRVVFSKGTMYTIGKALDLTKLKQIDLGKFGLGFKNTELQLIFYTDIQGNIVFTPDISYWSANAFKHTFQNAISFFQIGGVDVNVYGGGTLDGNGGVWGTKDKRPILFAINGLKGGQIADLTLKNSPQWFNIIRDSQDVVYSNIKISGKNKNTDGWE